MCLNELELGRDVQQLFKHTFPQTVYKSMYNTPADCASRTPGAIVGVNVVHVMLGITMGLAACQPTETHTHTHTHTHKEHMHAYNG